MSKISLIVVSLASVLALASCTTFEQRISITPLNTDFPVSASRGVLNAQGLVVPQKDLTIVDSFTFTKKYAAGIHSKSFELQLNRDLDELVKTRSADGIVELTIAFQKIDGSVVSQINNGRFYGAILLGVGLPVAYYGLAAKNDDPYVDNSKSLEAARNGGLTFTLTGAALVGLSLYLDYAGTANYEVQVTGKLFQYKK